MQQVGDAQPSQPSLQPPSVCRQGDLVWFDPDVGYFLPGILVDYSRGAQVATIEGDINGQVRTPAALVAGSQSDPRSPDESKPLDACLYAEADMHAHDDHQETVVDVPPKSCPDFGWKAIACRLVCWEKRAKRVSLMRRRRRHSSKD